MALEMLALLVVFGVGLVLLAVQFTGASRPLRFSDLDEARAALLRDFDQAQMRSGLLSADHTVAFFNLQDGEIAMVTALGSKSVSRIYKASEIIVNKGRVAEELQLDFHDFTFPRRTVRFSDESDARCLIDWMNGDNDDRIHSRLS